jgi:hypothetical protein
MLFAFAKNLILAHHYCRARAGLRLFTIAPYVVLTKLASTDMSEQIAAPTWALAFN